MSEGRCRQHETETEAEISCSQGIFRALQNLLSKTNFQPAIIRADTTLEPLESFIKRPCVSRRQEIGHLYQRNAGIGSLHCRCNTAAGNS